MNRRDLLLLKAAPDTRVFELACASLYMRYLGTQTPSAPTTALDDYWLGEPELQCASPSARELFDGLQRDLAGADLLRVVEPQWLADAELRQEVDALVVRFKASGGRVEIVTASSDGPRTTVERSSQV